MLPVILKALTEIITLQVDSLGKNHHISFMHNIIGRLYKTVK